MVSINQLRDYMRTQASEDRSLKSVEVRGESIEHALEQASIELGLPIRQLEYEVIQKGANGAFGVGKKEFILVAYELREPVEIIAADAADSEDIEAEKKEIIPEDRDGEIIVRLFQDGVFLKVLPPVGKGEKATERIALDALAMRGVSDYDAALVSKICKQSDSQLVRVGSFDYNPANDGLASINMLDQEMRAILTLTRPGPGGTDLTGEAILSFVKSNGVVHGIDEEYVRSLEEHPAYDQSLAVAEGTKPRNGDDARIEYNFDTDRSKVELLEKNGRVDFREMNLVQNVVEGQILAKKIPAQEGDQGRTVTGQIIPAKSGRDLKVGLGKNVRMSEDGLSVIATINGQVLINGDKINVEPVYTVAGDVNLKTGGNVIFLGTVIVKGSVDDGFKVKASGNVEVFGNVGKADIDAEGDVIVHQGVNGKTGGSIRAGRGVWAKFIENGNVSAGELAFATDGIINSHVDADKRIICQGRRATVVGGHLRAAEEINAKTLGSVAGSETILEVGYDPKKKAKLADLEEKIESIDSELEELNLNLKTLENLKKVKGALPEEREAYLNELMEIKSDSLKRKNEHLADIQEIHDYLANLKIRGKVSASSKVYPGVKIHIKDAALEVRNEFKAVTFINEANIVKVTEYEAPEEDFSKRR